jgi:hypothetical protein
VVNDTGYSTAAARIFDTVMLRMRSHLSSAIEEHLTFFFCRKISIIFRPHNIQVLNNIAEFIRRK